MKRITSRLRLPSPALIIAILALVVATAGTAFAASGLGILKAGAKNKIVGVGKLTYVTTLLTSAAANNDFQTSAACPAGSLIVGGGTKVTPANNNDLQSSYPTVSGWAVSYDINTAPATVQTTAICGKSRSVTGAPPAG